MKGHLKSVLYKILRTYLSHENYFSGGPYDKCVSKLKEKMKDEDIKEVLSVRNVMVPCAILEPKFSKFCFPNQILRCS